VRPLDLDTVLRSLSKTNRIVVVEEGPTLGEWASGLPGQVAQAAVHDLDDAWIVATNETPIPYSPTLEDAFLPNGDSIAEAVLARLGVPA
jgi:pyruvate/2-oxoglutarate/acetoin dehydrogenase E1 component